ncbi:MAG: hypothetical protein JKY87_07830 [Mariprofundus sp.]|nr:hypothetical protein [Mariprofundus sp.]
MNISICEAHISYPLPAVRWLIEEETQCGFELVAIADTQAEAERIYDVLSDRQEVSQ